MGYSNFSFWVQGGIAQNQDKGLSRDMFMVLGYPG